MITSPALDSFIHTMDQARANVRALEDIAVGEIPTALAAENYVPGGFARYLIMAAYRELYQGES